MKTPKSKVCATCNARKPINQPDHDDDGFGYQHNTADGYRPHCRACVGDMRRKSNRSRKGVRRETTAAKVARANTALAVSVTPAVTVVTIAIELATAVPTARIIIEPERGTVTIEPKGATTP